MTQSTKDELRNAVLIALVKRSLKSPGRTALMKFAYLLQTVRGVPLGYRFRMYNYGPYDEQVLVDAREAAVAGLLKSQLVMFPSGYGYEYSVGDSANCSSKEQSVLLDDCSVDIDWVIDNFGNDSASRLELVSTLIFALCDKNKKLERTELIARVHEIKPHFTKEAIGSVFQEVEGILECVNCGSN